MFLTTRRRRPLFKTSGNSIALKTVSFYNFVFQIEHLRGWLLNQILPLFDVFESKCRIGLKNRKLRMACPIENVLTKLPQLFFQNVFLDSVPPKNRILTIF
jgi:hypothetical protein